MMNLIRPLPDKPASYVSLATLVLPLLLYSLSLNAEDNKIDDKSVELETVRSQIKSVKTDLDSARTEYDRLQQELQNSEQDISQLGNKIRQLQQEIDKRHKRLEQLNIVVEEHQRALDREKQLLGQQVRAAYISGRSDYLKLILNQEDPTKVGRMLAYYDYFNRQRIASIEEVRKKVDQITSLQNSIEDETRSLEQLKEQQISRSQQLEKSRESRSQIMAQIQTEIEDKGIQLKTLEDHESKLTALVNKIYTKNTESSIFDKESPFSSLKGKLEWPIKGKLLNRFGGLRKGASLKWQGVRISADQGEQVTAISNGIVVFADWFRNLGQLIIIDHGDGYMSLYGYNSNLLKKAGDQVLSGETIAYAGDTGGQSSPALYFEIRYRGKPLNPVLWCKR